MSFPTKSQDEPEQALALLQNQQLAPVERIRQVLQPGILPDDILEAFVSWCLQQARARIVPEAGTDLPNPDDFRRIRSDLFDAVWRHAQVDPVSAWTAAWQSIWTTADGPAEVGQPPAVESEAGAPTLTYLDVFSADAAWLAAWTSAWSAGKQAVQQSGRAERPTVWASAWSEAWLAAWSGQVDYLITLLSAR